MFKFFRKLKGLKNRVIRKIKSYSATMNVDEGKGKFIFSDSELKIKIIKREGARLIMKGNVNLTTHPCTNDKTILLKLGKNSILTIEGDLELGNGVRISLSKGAQLNLGGKSIESTSKITGDTFIMVNKKLEIGKDFLCAWGVFITDSDWHQINNQPHQSDVYIGDHVWIANNSSVLKGTTIQENCVVASNTKLINAIYPSNSLIAGTPAKVVKSDINWRKDIV